LIEEYDHWQDQPVCLGWIEKLFFFLIKKEFLYEELLEVTSFVYMKIDTSALFTLSN